MKIRVKITRDGSNAVRVLDMEDYLKGVVPSEIKASSCPMEAQKAQAVAARTYAMMKKSANVLDVHHVHVWALSTTENALTAHVVLADVGLMEQTKKELKELFKHYNINHSTLEFESPDFSCEDHCN